MDAKQTVDQWADMLIMIWVERMAALGVSNAYLHASSFAYFVYASAGGDIDKINFVFNYYLKFTDMGVGKGVSLQDRQNMATRRKNKQWYSKTFLLEVKKLTNMLAEKYAQHVGAIIVENIKYKS